MGALSKEELDQVTDAWREERAARGHPIATKSVSQGNAALIKAIVIGIAPVIHELEKEIAVLSSRVAELERSQKTYLGVWKEGRWLTVGDDALH